MRTKWLTIFAVLCLALVSPVSTPRAQDPAPSPSPAGPMVGLSLIVTDKDGKSLNSISKDQIRVVENKTEQTILSLEADERPVDYVLLIDSTGSFKDFLQSAIDTAKLFVINRRPQDQVAVLRFASRDKIETVQEFSSDGDVLKKALDDLYVEEGQSAIIDALYLSGQYVGEHNKSNEDRRKAVVVFTDGEDRSSYYQQKALVQLLARESVQVFAFGLVTKLRTNSGFANKPSPRANAEKLLTTIANNSGGRVFFPETKEQVVQSAAEILLHLRAQFRIKYQSTTDASKTGFREVEVEFVSTDGEKRNLITPRAYWVGPKDPPDKKSEKKKKS